MSKIKDFLIDLLEWFLCFVLAFMIFLLVLYAIIGIITFHSKFPIVASATVLNGKRELVYIDKSEIKIGPDNVYYYDKDGHYTNVEAKGYIIYDKKENSIIYREGDYYAGFKLEGE